jgi:hypothetical protein
MKKRAFLSPLAISVAALLSVSPTAASTDPEVSALGINESAIKTRFADVLEEPLVLERSQAATIKTAYHRSHYSHRSHSSHQSHYSSY